MAELATVAGHTASRASLAAETVNRALLALTWLAARRDGAIDPLFEVAVLYHGGRTGVTSGLGETLSGRWTIGLDALAAQRPETARRALMDPADGESGPEDGVDLPIWARPSAEGEAHVDSALGEARALARRWSRDHPRSFPPVILTIGGGAMAGAGPAGAEILEALAAGRGPALVLHALLDDREGGPVRFPAEPTGDAEARWLFDRASPIPVRATWPGVRRADGPARGARGLLRDADAAEALESLFAPWIGAAPWPFGRGFPFGRKAPARSIARVAWGEETGIGGLAPFIGRARDARFDVRWCLAPKAGNRPRECEDALSWNIAAGRFCVTDGAGEGVFSRAWARTLAMGWGFGGVNNIDNQSLRAGVKSLDAILRERIARSRRNLRDRQGGNLFWFQTDDRVAEFAAFVGLDFAADGHWRALAVGDCCLFIERGVDLRAFPLTAPEDFSGGAYLVPSAIDADAKVMEHVHRLEGRPQAGDRFLLMSDAMACWYLSYPDRRARLREMLTRRDRRGLGALVTRERETRRLRNDDIAMLFIRIQSEN
jgi:hypothetical protein